MADIARQYGGTRWQIYDWRRRFRRGLLAAPKEDVASPAFVPLSVDDDPHRTPHADIVEVAIGDILIRVGRDDDRGHGGTGPPVVLFRYAPGRGSAHAERFLHGNRERYLQCDGYDGYELFTRIQRDEGPWTLVHCWSHLRRRFVKLMRNTKFPIAETAVRHIAALYAIEAENAVQDGAITVNTVRHTSKSSQCPGCATIAERVHSHYLRRLADLPLAGRQVRLIVIARRFRCDATSCRRAIFTEHFSADVLRLGSPGSATELPCPSSGTCPRRPSCRQRRLRDPVDDDCASKTAAESISSISKS